MNMSAGASREPVPMAIETLKKNLHLLLKSKPTNDTVFGWINTHVSAEQRQTPAFIRGLVTAVIEHVFNRNGQCISLVGYDFLTRCSIFKKYIQHNEEFELHVLYAIQTLVHKLEHPKNVLCQIFYAIHDENVISDNVFHQWRMSQDPAEQEGKQVALNELKIFFTCLKEMETDSAERRKKKVSRDLGTNEPSVIPVTKSEKLKTKSEKNRPTLRHQYSENQWSPCNPEGKRQYDRSFLLQLQTEPLSMKKPEGLPYSVIIKDSPKLHKLVFIVPDEYVPWPKQKMKVRLFQLFCFNPDNKEVFDWIETNVSAELSCQTSFAYSLVTAIISNAVTMKKSSFCLVENKLREWCAILRKYIDHKEESQLQALYATQVVMNKCKHPRGLLCSIFYVLYDEYVISSDMFHQWLMSEDPSDWKGKLQAVNSVQSFFTWLNNNGNRFG